MLFAIMNDPRIRNHAKLLVRYCIRAREKQTVGVTAGTAAEPLLLAVYEELLKAGAYPAVRLQPDEMQDLFFRYGRKHHFTTVSPFLSACADCMDATIGIYSQTNTKALSAVEPAKLVSMARAHTALSRKLSSKPWVMTLFPTNAYAQDAEMGMRDFEDFVYGAIFADEKDPIAAWRALGRQQERLIAKLRGADKVRIVGTGTDITLSVKGRRFINSDGRRNMPSGEVFAAPVETSADGVVEFDYPVCREGREIEGVRLVFRKGVVVEATATKNASYLKAELDTDAGSRRLGELGIGTNERIDRFIKNILFDEKIGGTVHLALGRSPTQTNGKNKSAIHWDMIKDLRKGGALYVDGKLFQKNGKFVV
jgi:aminopeptidase